MELKLCRKCGERKPLSAFHLVKSGDPSRGYRSPCKECGSATRRAWYEANNGRERAAASRREWRAADPARAWRAYLRGYGMTPERYEQMLMEQGGVCAICRRPCSAGGRLSVDHDHRCCPLGKSCGRCVRALLCRTCNRGLGHFSDDPEQLRAAAAYLESFGR